MIISNKNRFLFKPSLERVDCSKIYSRDNCVLVCLGTNLGRNDINLEEYLEYISKYRI